jgi:hypothetical protein
MENPTQGQVLQLAQLFSGFAKSVGDYRFAQFNNLTDTQVTDLQNAEDALRSASLKLADIGINLALDSVANALSGLGAITAVLKKDLTTIGDINKALQVVAVLFQLGTAVASGNPSGIAGAIQSAVTALAPEAKGQGG